jgi:hypothetical protein
VDADEPSEFMVGSLFRRERAMDSQRRPTVVGGPNCSGGPKELFGTRHRHVNLGR